MTTKFKEKELEGESLTHLEGLCQAEGFDIGGTHDQLVARLLGKPEPEDPGCGCGEPEPAPAPEPGEPEPEVWPTTE